MAAENDASFEVEQQMLADRLDVFEDAAVEHPRDPGRLTAWVRTLCRHALPDQGLEPRGNTVKGVAFRH